MAAATPLSPAGATVLAVDDHPENLDLVEAILEEEGFSVRRAADGEQALAAVAADPPDCIVLDVMMPWLDGFEVCRRLKSRRSTHFVPIVMLTALSEVGDKVRGLEAGADDFLNKPVQHEELIARVRTLVRIKRLREELDTSESIVVSMVQALESRDPLCSGHSERVAVTAVRLAAALGLDATMLETIGKAAMLHDLGKLGLPERLIRSDATFCASDRELLRRHPLLGEQILAPFESFAEVRTLIRRHHEARDGSGFPDGLGDELRIEDEVVALANLADHARLPVPGAGLEIERLRCTADGKVRRELVEALAGLERTSERGCGWAELLPPPATRLTGRIVVADDTEANLDILHEILMGDGHEVVRVEGGAAALAAIADCEPDLVLVDVRMPDLDGFDVCRIVRSDPATALLPVILITAFHDRDGRRTGIRAGADDFLFLPVNRLELSSRVRSLLRLKAYFEDLEEYRAVMLSLAAALEAKDAYTHGHSQRVARLAVRLGAAVGMSPEACRDLEIAGLLHDIGKIGIPEDTLNKPSALTGSEREAVQTHPTVGEMICRPLRTVQSILPLVRHHHERLDGSGYPDGLRGEAIPIGARVLALADAFDALTSTRPYRGAMSPARALEILRGEAAAGKWDHRLLVAFEALVGP